MGEKAKYSIPNHNCKKMIVYLDLDVHDYDKEEGFNAPQFIDSKK